ncbi:MAG TPA: hypothetical protein VLM39_02860 [Ignavibacteriaceae bacterium]|nr:hypothetical protein [Ignavibacteriaceae bacterium]
MIENFLKIIFFLSVLSVSSYSQTEKTDSVKINFLLFPSEGVLSKFDEFDFYSQLNSMRMNVPLNYDTNTVWLWTLFALSKPEFGKKEFGKTPGNISQFLYDDYIQESKFNPVKYVLGMAQVGAVGYLAYRHIKKYGFLK